MSQSATGAVAIVPVRVDSQRLPGKALLRESGQALFLHTCERARQAGCFDQVVVATDDDRVIEAANAAGYATVVTSSQPRTGSERCAEALPQLPDARMIVDVQGDWPTIEPDDLTAIVKALDENDARIVTLAVEVEGERQDDPNVVKVVRDLTGNALYFSRCAIPFHRPSGQRTIRRLRHIGVYGFGRSVLERIADLPSSGLDEIESLEQLRFLENGIPIRVLDGSGDPWGIEARADYDTFLQELERRREAP